MKKISIFFIGILCISCTNSIFINEEKYVYKHDKIGKEISFKNTSDDKKVNLDFKYEGNTKEISLENIKEEASKILSSNRLNKIVLKNITYEHLVTDYKNQEFYAELIYSNKNNRSYSYRIKAAIKNKYKDEIDTIDRLIVRGRNGLIRSIDYDHLETPKNIGRSDVADSPIFTAHPTKDKLILTLSNEKILYYINNWEYSFGIDGKIVKINTMPLKPQYYWKYYYYTTNGLETGKNSIYPHFVPGLPEMIERERLEEKKNGYGEFEGKELEKFIRDRKYVLTITENVNGENVKSLEMKFNKKY
ncbi:MAG: hypothetical protein LBT51_09840, partial [Fusobacteriaceae bacterium]|nr:hypothetical protein [Fusobacteriaceae bacterium]